MNPGTAIVRRLLRKFDEVELVRKVLLERGVMIDVGAHFGSSALPFVKAGWNVHAFEPDPVNRYRLQDAMSEFNNATIIPAAVSNTSGRMMLYRSEVSTGISSLTSFHESHNPAAEVEVTTLTEYVKATELTGIDFLKIDSEGYDLFVLQGVPWDKLKPKVVVCEFENRKTVPLGYEYQDLAEFLVNKEYDVLVSEWYPIVEYGGNHRWRRLHRYPYRLADNDAWGNLIAVPSHLRPTVERWASLAAARNAVRSVLERFVVN